MGRARGSRPRLSVRPVGAIFSRGVQAARPHVANHGAQWQCSRNVRAYEYGHEQPLPAEAATQIQGKFKTRFNHNLQFISK